MRKKANHCILDDIVVFFVERRRVYDQ